MDTTKAIRELKRKIVDLSGKQKFLKRARKSSLPEEERVSLLKLGSSEWKPSSPWESHVMAAIDVVRRRAMITAAINLSHELRGSEHRHGHGDEYLYGKCRQELLEELLAAK